MSFGVELEFCTVHRLFNGIKAWPWNWPARSVLKLSSLSLRRFGAIHAVLSTEEEEGMLKKYWHHSYVQCHPHSHEMWSYTVKVEPKGSTWQAKRRGPRWGTPQERWALERSLTQTILSHWNKIKTTPVLIPYFQLYVGACLIWPLNYRNPRTKLFKVMQV